MIHELAISSVAVAVCTLAWMIGWIEKNPSRIKRAYTHFSGSLAIWAASSLLLSIDRDGPLAGLARVVWSLGWPVVGYLALGFVLVWLGKQKKSIQMLFLSTAMVSIPLWLFDHTLQFQAEAARTGILITVMIFVNLGLPAVTALLMSYWYFYRQPTEERNTGWAFLLTGVTSLVILSVVAGGLGEYDMVAPMLVVASIGGFGSMYFGHMFSRRLSERTKKPSFDEINRCTGPTMQAEQAPMQTLQPEDENQQAQRMEALGRLAGGVAHDFNNLLSAILGFGGIIKESLDPDDELQEDVKELLVAARRAASLTRQLLAFSRRESNVPEVHNLNEIVDDMEKMLRRIIGEDIVLLTGLSDECWPVVMDRGQMEQVLVNLVVNARDAMPVGGRLNIETLNLDTESVRKITRSHMQPGRYVCLRVEDNGIGIPSDLLDHIFEPFVSSKPFGKGTGLGLATVYGIVRQMGGEIYVSSQAGEGARFDLLFPAASADEARETTSEQAPMQVFGTETVLLVEDDRAVRALAARILSAKGYQVLEAENGEKAVELSISHRGPIHLLLTDMIMPGMNGKQCAEKVLASRGDTQVLYMSGYTNDVLAQRGLLDNGLQFLEKPLEADKLLSKLASVLYVSNN